MKKEYESILEAVCDEMRNIKSQLRLIDSMSFFVKRDVMANLADGVRV